MSASTQGAPPPVPADWARTLGGAELHLSGEGDLRGPFGKAELVLLQAKSRRRLMNIEEETAAQRQAKGIDLFLEGIIGRVKR